MSTSNQLIRTNSNKNISDSQLIISQANGQYEAKDKRTSNYLELVKILFIHFEVIEISQVPQTQNEQVDALANLASSSMPLASSHITMESIPVPSICLPIVSQIESTPEPVMWMAPILKYLRDGDLQLRAKRHSN